MTPAGESSKSLTTKHGARRRAVVELLLRDIFQGRLKAGQHLVTQALAERFGVSHTPIREALITLAGIGVIQLNQNRGAKVLPVTRSDIRDLCQVRRALECEAVRGACGKISEDDLGKLKTDLVQLVEAPALSWASLVDEARAVDSRLHDLIARSCGNLFLAKEIGRLKILFRAFRDIAWEHEEFRRDFGRLSGEAHEHLAIVEALQANDRRRATFAMAKHIRIGQRFWSRALPGADHSDATQRRDHSASYFLD